MTSKRRLAVRSEVRFSPSRAAASLLKAGALLLLVACDEEPVSQNVNLEMLEEGRAAITLQVSINPDVYDSPERESKTFVEFARSLFDRTGVWEQRFSGIEVEREIERSEKDAGELVEYVRSVEVVQEEIPRFFADCSLTFHQTSGPGWRELSIVPGESARASRDVKRFVDGALDHWSREIAEYTNATSDLYRYLDAQPHRSEALLGHVFLEQLSDEDRNRIGEISEEEEPYVGRVRRAIRAAMQRADVDGPNAVVIGIATRLVHDPFPARFTIRLPKGALEVEGFRERSERLYEVPQPSVWEVLLSFEGRWSDPELLTMLVDATQDPPKPIDLEALASRPRRAAVGVSAADVKAAIEKALRPAAIYRVRWAE